MVWYIAMTLYAVLVIGFFTTMLWNMHKQKQLEKSLEKSWDHWIKP